MKYIGKCEPEPEALEHKAEIGFDSIELYLSKSILDEMSVDEILDNCHNASVSIDTVHTPHIKAQHNPLPYFELTDTIASELDAVMVLDSNPTGMRYLADVYPPEQISADTFGYENNPSDSAKYISQFHLKNGLPLILDSAHLHMSTDNTEQVFENLLEQYPDQITGIHLADGTQQDDGWKFGTGTIDIARLVEVIEAYEYDGPVVLETSQDVQEDALQFVQSQL